MSLHISPLDLHEPSHTSALIDLLDHYARDPMGGGTGLSVHARTHLVEALRLRADYFAHLAWLEGEAVGLINCFEGFSSFAARPLLNVHDLAVRREHRGKGIGRALLAAAEAQARARGCCKLTLEVLDRNAVAMSAYLGFGFAPYALDPAAGSAVFLQKLLD
ncbi:GNAT family N-acetyltransferase [Uliginosibacterium sp. H3]|uniref:GNAT family N-acetyltransferase n=1 Tax=Uliginosibacterium silvisoli TaxID=3114758 RepID=A0ABU6K180_9RHOO|nr:GNAT family N-acetyltransferase [Uliginosibacterium sp. H3]